MYYKLHFISRLVTSLDNYLPENGRTGEIVVIEAGKKTAKQKYVSDTTL